MWLSGVECLMLKSDLLVSYVMPDKDQTNPGASPTSELQGLKLLDKLDQKRYKSGDLRFTKNILEQTIFNTQNM